MDSGETYTRRGLLKTGASVGAAGTVAAAATGSASAQDQYGGFLSDAPNFEGETADATGMEEVTVTVGAGNQGLLFDPPSVVVDPGTTIDWSWTGAGGAHNVYNTEGSEPLFSSGSPVDTEGVDYSFTFEDGDTGAHPYVCQPHEALGMKGVVVVGEDNVEGNTYPFGATEESLRLGAIFGGSAVFGVAALLGVAAYRDLFGDEDSEY